MQGKIIETGAPVDAIIFGDTHAQATRRTSIKYLWPLAIKFMTPLPSLFAIWR